MSRFIIGFLSVLVALQHAPAATNSPAPTNTIAATNSASAKAPDPNDPVEKDFQKLLAADDASQEEVDEWIRENNEFATRGAGLSREEMNFRIQKRFEPVRKGYEDFLKRHPDHVRARIAYGSFLGDINDEDGSFEQWQKAAKLDPGNPAVWNNLANYHGHRGPPKKALEYYEKAIELDPNEPVYYHNFGTTVFLFRKDVMEYYGINEQQVFDKALELYDKAMKLSPGDFPLATDIANTYYGVRPPRTDDALKAWTNALHLARDPIEREGVYIHFGRVKLNAGRFDEARAHLNAVTNSMYADLKQRLLRNLNEKEAAATNAPAKKVEP